jgi:uncharacterized membrane protein YdjX (TVP38/TMEM64 family)
VIAAEARKKRPVDPVSNPTQSTASRGGLVLRGVLLLIAVAAVVIFFRVFDGNRWIRALLEGIRGLGPFGPILLVTVYIVGSVLFIPGSLLTLGAGFVFGLLPGYVYVTIGSVLGATAAFLVGRTLARRRIESRLSGNPRFRAIDEAVARKGWTIVFLTRLSPVFPFNLQNYMYGVTGVSLRDYFLASWIGMIPGTLLYVYLGSAAESLAQVASGDVGGGSLKLVLFAAGLVATIAVTAYVTKVARAALREAIEPANDAGDPSNADSRTNESATGASR